MELIHLTQMKVNWVLNDLTAFLGEAANLSSIAFDVETTVTEDHTLRLMQFGLPTKKQYLFTPEYLPKLRHFLEQNTLIAHNAIFEIGVMAANGVYPKKWIDTMLIEQIILGGDPNHEGAGLAKVMHRYFDIEMDKTMQTAFGNSIMTKAHYNYAAGDVAYLHDIVNMQKKNSLYNAAVVELETTYLNVVAEMHQTGFKVDVNGWQEVINSLEDELKDAETQLNSYALNINWNSPKQKLLVLDYYKVPVTSTSKVALLKYSHIPLVRDLLSYAEINSKVTKQGKKFIDKVKDGIIRTDYKQILNTGRSSSRNVNLQNIPKPYRKYFSPSTPGNVFVSADYSQQELVILGFAAGEQSWIDAAANSEDLHSFCARALYPSFDDLGEEEQKVNRKKIKAINFSLAYGTGLKALANNLKMPYNDTFKLVVKYYKAFPKIETYLANQSINAKKDAITTTLPPFSRKRILHQEQPNSMGRKGKNTPIQGSAADMVKLACNLLAAKKLPLKFTHVIHDEILVECKPEHAQEIEGALIGCMEAAGDVICPSGLIHVDSNISNHW